jgi:hypothetical protein
MSGGVMAINISPFQHCKTHEYIPHNLHQPLVLNMIVLKIHDVPIAPQMFKNRRRADLHARGGSENLSGEGKSRKSHSSK